MDEYQDLNLAQYRLLRLLASGGANLCVIGDPDQAIYGFRGADRSYFVSFADDFPDAKTVRLSQNYRSTQLILDAAQQVIARNPDRAALEIWSEFATQTRLSVHPAPTDRAEAEYVVHQIEQMIGGVSYFSLDSGRVDDRFDGADGSARSFGDYAVLYRTSAQNRTLAEALDRSGFPYQIVGQTPLTGHADIRYLLAHLWLLVNPRSTVHWDIVLNQGRSIFAPEMLDEIAGIAWHGGGLTPGALERIRLLRLSGAQQRRVESVVTRLRLLSASAEERPVAHLIDLLITQVDDGIGTTATPAQVERRQQLQRRAALYDNRLQEFLESMLLEREADAFDPRADRVTLMTLHASKGLEFPVVFIVGCEEGLLPYVREGEPTDVEEERRLFYVGMTRAREKLILTHAGSRFLFGQRLKSQPSRFVEDIEDALKELSRMPAMPSAVRVAKSAAESGEQLKLF
ncbi:MAG: UvrD-helicase domain-containing protein [Caldilineaceae bacterium]|nr:UvrD-helicase domain-containing protein [Caldilineaceae bacterium]